VVAALALAIQGAASSAGLVFAIGLLVANAARKRERRSGDFLLGAISEERVAALLEELERLGWSVEHDVAKGSGGNIDHIVHSPRVTFTIDTKRSRWRERDLGQAHRHLEWAGGYFAWQQPIVPVICIERSGAAAHCVAGVHIVGAGRLLDFLEWESGAPASVPFEDPPFGYDGTAMVGAGAGVGGAFAEGLVVESDAGQPDDLPF
jgi:hypothetical protein